MLITVTGGASSGKSELGENLARNLGGKLLYIATMEPFGEEGQMRVQRHRALRQGKGFETLEVYRDLGDSLQHPLIQEADTVLLECALNLLANESFSPSRADGEPVSRITRDILALRDAVSNLVVITGEVFSDGESYPFETARYIRDLGALNRFLARESQMVLKSVAGIPVFIKGGPSHPIPSLDHSDERGICR